MHKPFNTGAWLRFWSYFIILYIHNVIVQCTYKARDHNKMSTINLKYLIFQYAPPCNDKSSQKSLNSISS